MSIKSLYYYPTTIALVDDNFSYLSNLSLKLSKKWPTCLFESPKVALEYIFEKNLNQLNPLTHDLSNSYYKEIDKYDEVVNSKTINLSLSNLYKKIYDNDRFNEISTLLVDFDMPIMNGVDFCKELKEKSSIRKVMLTGKADNAIAVKAFNNEVLDKFIIKGVDDIDDELLEIILLEEKKYFNNLLSSFEKNIIFEKGSIFQNENYLKLFNQVCDESNFVEYYALDFKGSFLFLDKNASPTVLLISSLSEFDNYYQTAIDLEAKGEIVRKLHNKTHLLYLLHEEDYKVSSNDWIQFLYPCLKSKDERFFYAILNCSISGIDLSKVRSFDSYMKSQKPFK